MKEITQKVQIMFAELGNSQYGGEAVSQLEHALQCAQLASDEGASSELIVASLLHDVGHLLHALPDDAPENGIDDMHENLAKDFLSRYFQDEVTEPIYLHVNAKRYLCTREAGYQALLSEPSLLSLQLQGGPMSEQECLGFEQNPHFHSAIQLRKYDDAAKIPDLQVLPLTHYLKLIEAIAL
ncbi:metal-dependent phosphohydrolase [Aquirufa nivalisilvae]|uniref:phosphonate degradation HD-domain oxygenase n=1 Tax=Aquirufa nivalisilvae TaxID=2516557 RepID=UPI0022A9DB0B|nr:phosphonate degradation HD-domain oxygenase [Aquirufa nivalisilvae]MCZ2481346.1 metal-dependent phosphohydrolase [Aquirufa nivalisilvae]